MSGGIFHGTAQAASCALCSPGGSNLIPGCGVVRRNGATPLHYAAEHDQAPCILSLLRPYAKKKGGVSAHDFADNEGRRALIWAVSKGRPRDSPPVSPVMLSPLLLLPCDDGSVRVCTRP